MANYTDIFKVDLAIGDAYTIRDVFCERGGFSQLGYDSVGSYRKVNGALLANIGERGIWTPDEGVVLVRGGAFHAYWKKDYSVGVIVNRNSEHLPVETARVLNFLSASRTSVDDLMNGFPTLDGPEFLAEVERSVERVVQRKSRRIV